jgi:hypothetical protein
MYALVVDGQIQSTGRLPESARRLDDGAWVMGLATAGLELQAACGYLEVVEPTRPTITTAQTFDDDTIELVAGVPTRVYHVRAKTAGELANDVANANRTLLSDRATIEADITALKTFLTDVDIDAVLAQANNTALPTATLNRALKTIVRQLRRDANFDIRLARYTLGQVHPELLADISDTRPA